MSQVFGRALKRSFHCSRVVANYSTVQLKLFSKANCRLCVTAKVVLEEVVKDSEFAGKLDYELVDIDDPNNKEWWEKYCFDIPVLHIEDKRNPDSLVKIFHRMKKEDVIEKIKALQ